MSHSLFHFLLSLSSVTVPSNHKYMQNLDLIRHPAWWLHMKRHAYATRSASSSTHTSTLRELWLTAWKLTPNFFFANLKANYCIFDSWLIGLLAMNLNMNKKGNRCIFWSNCDKTGTRQCMDRNCDRLYFMNINYCRVIQMLFNLLSKLMLINIHKTSKAETGEFQFQPKAVLIWALCLPFFQ